MLKCTGHPDVRHVDCGGQIAVDGTGYVQLPIGFGFAETKPDRQQFVVDVVRYPAYSGWCLKCQAKGMFVRTDRKPKPKRTIPRGINRKIKAAAGA